MAAAAVAVMPGPTQAATGALCSACARTLLSVYIPLLAWAQEHADEAGLLDCAARCQHRARGRNECQGRLTVTMQSKKK